MAEALVSVLLERLANITMDKVQGEFNLITGVEEEVATLTRNLKGIQAVIKHAEARQEVEEDVRHWLNELNQVSHEMDNVLDEWSTQVRKEQMEAENQKKVCCPSFSSCFRYSQLKKRRAIALRIGKLNRELALIDKKKQIFNFSNYTARVPEIPRQETTCFLSDKIFGREMEKDIILSKLLSEGGQDSKVPLIIPIVGMGGMGKTTLCQQVYNDDKVKTHFDKRIWVCVSDPFDEIKIARAIVEGLDSYNVSKSSNSLQILMESIDGLIQEKKFLLVLDDVWNPRRTQWEELIKTLCHGAMGSGVLVTTRNEEVATLMKATTHIIHMKQLSEDICLSLFYYNAERDIDGESKMFRDVGEKIVKKCDGLPLAAKTLGSLMRDKKTLKEWEDVLNSKWWELEDIEQQVFRPLLLSYYDLSPEIRNCLLYCVIFPKDFEYDKDNLVELWMSQNYLNTERSREFETLGQKYFDKLVMRSFFQEVEVDGFGKTKCKIHDIIHDFMLYLTKNEFLTVNVGQPSRSSVNDEVRHLSLIRFGGSGIWDSCHINQNLRTLVVLDYGRLPDFSISQKEIMQLKSVRTLSCFSTGIKQIPKEIGGLIHLRYLDLSKNPGLEKLPDTMGGLYNLQTLRLAECPRLKEVELGSLINLRHLNVGGSEKLKPRGIERLTNLQTLDEFNIQDGDDGNKLEHLRNLNQLQGCLTIKHNAEPTMTQTEEATEGVKVLVSKAQLLHLVLDVGKGWRPDLMALQPPSGLESLSINGYKPMSTDWWSSLHRLRMVEISVSQFLPCLGNLVSLESLSISQVMVRKVGDDFLGIHDESETSFPKLKQLSFHHMPNWKEWEGVLKEGSKKMATSVMPCLSVLTIASCDKLEALPEFLWKTPLQKLSISNSLHLQRLYRRETGQLWAKIAHIPTIHV